MPTPFRLKTNRPARIIGPILPFLLSAPLLIAALVFLANNQINPFIGAVGAWSMYLLSGYFLKRARQEKAKAATHRWRQTSRTPWHLSAALFSSGATALVSLWCLDSSIMVAFLYAALTFQGMVFYYGLDASPEPEDITLDGISREELAEGFDQAYAKIEAIEQAARKIKHGELSTRLNSVAQGSRTILTMIESDPKDYNRARKFLKVYLKGVQQVAEKYSLNDHVQSNDTLKTNLVEVLDTMDSVIAEQQSKLQEDDVLELDIQLEVLQTQLKHEGIR